MADASNLPFIRTLASNEKKIRTKAIEQLTSFLSTRRAPAAILTLDDALKLWKGLFYAVWMCDRPVPQQTLCAELGGLISVVDSAAVGSWLTAFWTVMAQNWNTEIDVLRMEKFLLLVRRVVAGSLRRLRADGFSPDARTAVLDTLRVGPLNPDGDLDRMPVGLRLHVIDLWVDELEREGYLCDDEEVVDKKGNKKQKQKKEVVREAEKDVVQEITNMVKELTLTFPSKSVRDRAIESLEDERLAGNMGNEDKQDDDDASWDGFDE
ncbi:Ribosomal RNA-processing protein 1-like protein [Ceratocystis lukuohia]|uniref:Ribosomal RNA-processing protein 1 n=2 Tax=Ceratocystis TaxID=5157 RepID=A0A0F8DEW2_CERFI|nr:hypothetical protein CFO_g3146 [Ceratocystis platani]